jgi:hypothetical protein
LREGGKKLGRLAAAWRFALKAWISNDAAHQTDKRSFAELTGVTESVQNLVEKPG